MPRDIANPWRPKPLERWLTEHEVAARLDVHPGSLARWRSRRQGPPYVKLGKHQTAPVRYPESELVKWMEGQFPLSERPSRLKRLRAQRPISARMRERTLEALWRWQDHGF